MTLWLFHLDPIDVTRYAGSFFALQAMPIPTALEENMARWGTEAKHLLLSVGPDGLPCLSPWAVSCASAMLTHRLTFSSDAVALHLCRLAGLHWFLSLTDHGGTVKG